MRAAGRQSELRQGGVGDIEPRETGPVVFPEVARFTRICAYDRPGTTGALASEPIVGSTVKRSRSSSTPRRRPSLAE